MGASSVLRLAFTIRVANRFFERLRLGILWSARTDVGMDDSVRLRAVQRCLLPTIRAASMGTDDWERVADDLYFRRDAQSPSEWGLFLVGFWDEHFAQPDLFGWDDLPVLGDVRKEPRQGTFTARIELELNPDKLVRVFSVDEGDTHSNGGYA